MLITHQQAGEIKRAGPVDPQAKQERRNHKTMPAPARTMDCYEREVEILVSRWGGFVDGSTSMYAMERLLFK